MSTETGTSRTRRARPAPDPLQMSAAEKCMAEWEARHDVAARGHRGSPEALQQYCAHSRQPSAAPSRATGASARPVRERHAPVVAEPSRPRRGRLLSRLLRRSG